MAQLEGKNQHRTLKEDRKSRTNSLDVLLAVRISMKLCLGVPYTIHPPIVSLTPCITDDMVRPHLADASTGRWEVLNLFDLRPGFRGVLQLP